MRTDWNLPKTLAELYAKTRLTENGCREWTGTRDKRGYGRILRWVAERRNNRSFKAYRVAYELAHGPIPPGLEPDHTCRNPACVLVEHLEAVSHRENILRGESPAAKHARKVACIRGHDLSGHNLIRRNDNGGRRCRTCTREGAARRRAERRAACAP